MVKKVEENFNIFQEIKHNLEQAKVFLETETNISKSDFHELQTQIEEELEKFQKEKKTYFENKDKAFSLCQNGEPFQRLLNNLVGKTEEKIREIEYLKDILVKLQNNYLHDEKLIDSKASSLSSDGLDGRMLKCEVVKEEDFLKQRKNELENMKIVSSTLKDMTEIMGVTVEKQKDKLNKIEEQINEMQNNVDKAEKNIEESREKEKKNSNKTWLYVVIIIIVIILLAAIVLSIAIF